MKQDSKLPSLLKKTALADRLGWNCTGISIPALYARFSFIKQPGAEK